MGCIPTKSLLHTADVWEHFVNAEADGIHVENARLEYPKVKDRKDGIVNKHSNGVGMLLKRAKVERISGYATLKGGGKVEVKSDSGVQTLEAKNIIIATGSEARMLPGLQPDPEFILTNIEILNLTVVPKSLIVIGAGAVGVEFASIFKRFGTDVTIIEMLPRVVPVEDEDVSKELERVFKKQKIRVETGAKAENIQKTGKGVKLTLTTKDGKQEQLEAEKLLVAVGRKPNTENIGIENTKVQLDRGFIKVNAQQQTSDSAIYAIGDIAGGVLLAHKASKEARIAVEVITGEASSSEQVIIPAVVFTDPEVAWCGLTEAEAKSKGIAVEVAKFPWAASGRALTLDRTDGLTKLIIDPETERILGVGMVGHGAGELIAEGVVAVEMGATARDLAESVHPHPTLSETLMEAAEVFFGNSSHTFVRKRSEEQK